MNKTALEQVGVGFLRAQALMIYEALHLAVIHLIIDEYDNVAWRLNEAGARTRLLRDMLASYEVTF